MEVPVLVENEEGKVKGSHNVGIVVNEADFGESVDSFVKKAIEALQKQEALNANS